MTLDAALDACPTRGPVAPEPVGTLLDQAGLAAGHREIEEADWGALVRPGGRAAAGTRSPVAHLDVHRIRAVGPASTMPRMITAGSPTSSPHMRVGPPWLS